MTNAQKNHMRTVCLDTSKAVVVKYKAGQKEHGGNLWRKPVINFMGDELTDHIVYFHVLKQQWKEMEKIAKEGLNTKVPQAADALVKILNILTIGNAEGKREEGD